MLILSSQSPIYKTNATPAELSDLFLYPLADSEIRENIQK